MGLLPPCLDCEKRLHVLGLEHPFDGNNKFDTPTDIIPDTVMSYSATARQHPIQPMALDVDGGAGTDTGCSS